MKHWQYTEASNTCKICGYETHSLPTYRRHVKHCGISEPGNTGASSLPEASEISSKAKSTSEGDERLGLQIHSNVNHAEVDGLSTTEDQNTLEVQEEDIKQQKSNATLKVESCAEVPPRKFAASKESSVKLVKNAEKDDVSGSKCGQWKASAKKIKGAFDEQNMPAGNKEILKMSCEEKQVTDEPVNFVCVYCDFASTDERTFQSHLESCSNKDRKYSCSECEFACDDDSAWAKHKLQKHLSGTVHSCSECLYKTALKKNFDRHRACHRVNAAFKCDFCSYSSTGESAVRRHISSYHLVEESQTLESPEEPNPKSSSKSKQGKKKSSRCIQESPTKSESLDDTVEQIDSCENTAEGGEAVTEDSDIGEALLGEVGVNESQDVDLDGKLDVDIVWSCFWCKLDFKNRQEMDAHTKLEHSIELKDCMLYSLDKDATSETLFDLEQEQLPEILTATLTSATSEKIHRCELCEYRGRRPSDLRQHFTRKHSQNSSEPDQKTRKRPSNEDWPPGSKSKKAKISKTASDESSTILAKLLQNDDPNSVYNPSNSNSSSGDENTDKSQKNKTDKAAMQSSNKSAYGSGLDAENVDDGDDDDAADVMSQVNVAANKSQTITEVIGPGGNVRKQRNHTKMLTSNQGSDRAVEYFMSLMCNYCGYLGDSPAEVERHTHTHTGIKTHWCPLCEYKTIWKCDMKRHLTKAHQSESSSPNCLAKLLHMAYRPDGKHTVEELDRISPQTDGKGVKKGSPMSSLKTKFKWVKMQVSKSPSGHVKDSTSSIIPSKKLLKKAKQKLLVQQISQLVKHDMEMNLEQELMLPLKVANVKQEETHLAEGLQSYKKLRLPDETAVSVPDELTFKRCRPFKCSECGKRSNWKWDIKKHIAEHHPAATLITLSKEEALKSFAEIVRMHHEKQLQSGQMPQVRRIRIGTTYEQIEDAGIEDHRLLCAAAISSVAEDGEEMEKSMQRSAESSLPGIRSIHKGMVDLDKLKRFKCSGCIYRSNFRGDISRHIRSKHTGARCSVILMSAGDAAASLNNYNWEWEMRRINPTSVDDSSPNSDNETPKQEETLLNHNTTSSEGTNGNGKLNQHTKAADNHGGNRVALSVKRKNGGDAEDCENLKRRMRPQIEESEMRCCNICPYATEKSDLLKLHMSYHQPQARNGYSCTYCPYFVNTERLLDHHLLLHASKEPVCRSMNYSPKAPVNSKVSRTKYICDKCPFTSNQRDLYLQHRSKHFEKSSAVGKCSYCPYWAPEKRDLSQHQKLHVKFYFPRALDRPAKPRGDGISCRCVFADCRNDDRFRCGCELQCLYCTFTIASVTLIRRHIVFCHMGFTDAIKNKFFDKSLDDADDYLFIPCKYQPSKTEKYGIELENECSEFLLANYTNILEESKMVTSEKILTDTNAMALSCTVLPGTDKCDENPSKFSLASDEVLMSTKSDDALSVETVDTDLPELEMFSCGNSDISDKTTSPCFVEAELMEVAVASSELRLHAATSEIEHQMNSEAFSPDETPSVVELAVIDILLEPKKLLEGDVSSSEELQSGEAASLLELPLDKEVSEELPETLLVKELLPNETNVTETKTYLIVDLPALGKTESLDLSFDEMISIPTSETSSQELRLNETVSRNEVPSDETESFTSNAFHSSQASASSSLPQTTTACQKTDISDDLISTAETSTHADAFLKLLRSLGLNPVQHS